jgi:hypothetical protein
VLVGEGIALDLQDVQVDRIEVAGNPNEVSLESLMGSQAMTEFGGSVLPVGCCSCCIPCCCCCG